MPTATVPEPVEGYVPLAALPRPSGLAERLESVVRAARAGVPGAAPELLALLKPVIARYCRARIGGRDLSYLSADDVAQEVCIAVLQAVPGYEDRGGSFLHLVRAIAANKVADAFRAVSRDRSRPVSDVPENADLRDGPESHTLTADLGASLGRLLAGMPKLQQEILTLRVVVGLTSAETGKALGISPGNVRVTQCRALAKLRDSIHEQGLAEALLA
ncbi:RNA polymerase sigma-70 factor (ECF subfamily) [Amycolatopsis echigonensis]|uniref:RNA polymerase sigma-70 factor (ECF subfamily) n=1 Tax=Amycolatopsis echigonensis TaxID=2576905 RepID=A0A2N3WQ91_9PSEU|nr:RNA polymerase sigma factor ShbA [Amycolatopsis niigatensis]PKV96056.1 RNA polymerase sigma-70 factor (ECF subfamily) [Amycolatopsis niigatensis]